MMRERNPKKQKKRKGKASERKGEVTMRKKEKETQKGTDFQAYEKLK